MVMDNKESKRKRHCFDIDLHLIPPKIAFFVLYSFITAYTIFINPFLTSIGLSHYDASFISGMSYLFSAIIGPIWGVVVDSVGKRKGIFIILCLGAAASLFSVPWIVTIVTKITLKRDDFLSAMIANNSAEYSTESANNSLHTNFTSICISQKQYIINNGNRSAADETFRECVVNSNQLITRLFYFMLGCLLLANMFLFPLAAFLDAFMMTNIKNSKKNICYGGQRLFGSLGGGFVSYVVGISPDYYHDPIMPSFSPLFYISPFVLVLIPLSYVLLKHDKKIVVVYRKTGKSSVSMMYTSAEVDDSVERNPKIQAISFNVCDKVLIMLTVVLTGIFNNITVLYLFPFLNEISASKTVSGVTFIVIYSMEVFSFSFSEKIIKFFHGPVLCIEIAVLSYFLRFILTSFIEGAWVGVLQQLYHGAGFALLWASLMNISTTIRGRKVCVSTYSMFFSLYYGIGGFIGNIGISYALGDYNARTLFRYAGIFAGIWAFSLFIYFQGIPFAQKKLMKRTVPASHAGGSDDENAI